MEMFLLHGFILISTHIYSYIYTIMGEIFHFKLFQNRFVFWTASRDPPSVSRDPPGGRDPHFGNP